MKKINKSLWKGLVLTSGISLLSSTISCNKDVVNPDIKNSIIELNDVGKTYTIDDFANKLKTNSEINTFLNQTTNLNTFLKYDLNEFEFETKVLTVDNTNQVIKMNFNVYKKTTKALIETNNVELRGFKINNNFDELVNEFENLTKSLTIDRNKLIQLSKSNDVLTSDEMIDKYLKNSLQFNNIFHFVKASNYDLSRLYYKGIKINVEKISSNAFEIDWNKKGNEIQLVVNLQAQISNQGSNIIGEKNITIKVGGFDSYQTKFDHLKTKVSEKLKQFNSAVSLKITNPKGKSSYSTRAFLNFYNKQCVTPHSKNQFIVSNFKNFRNDLSFISAIDKDIKLNFENLENTNNNILTLRYNFEWKEKTDKLNSDLTNCLFSSDTEYFNEKINKINQNGFQAINNSTNDPRIKLTSEQVANIWKNDKNLIEKYINTSELLDKDWDVEYKIINADWNKNDSLDLQGKVLLLDLQINFLSYDEQMNRKVVKTYDLTNVKATGFMPQIQIYKLQFEDAIKVNKIIPNSLSKQDSIIASSLNNNNYKNYLQFNWEEQKYKNATVKNLIFTPNDDNGTCEIQLTYVWTTTSNDNLFAAKGQTIEVRTTKTITSLQTGKEKATENIKRINNTITTLDKVDKDGTSSYLNSIKKPNINYGDYLSSSFVTTNSQSLSKLFELWNLPGYDKTKLENYGIETKLISIFYSQTDKELKDNQLKFTLRFSNKYDASNFIEKTFIVGSLFEPFTDDIYYQLEGQDYEAFEDPLYPKWRGDAFNRWSKVPEEYRKGVLNYQTTYLSWWYDGNVDALKYIDAVRGNNSKKSEWVNWAKSQINNLNYVKNYSTFAKKDIKVTIKQIDWKSELVRNIIVNNIDSDGVGKFPTTVVFQYETFAVDKKGNKAEGKYSVKISKPKIVNFYFKSNFWDKTANKLSVLNTFD